MPLVCSKFISLLMEKYGRILEHSHLMDPSGICSNLAFEDLYRTILDQYVNDM